jgi:DNA-binding NarL/FixJ family response regulator
MADTGCVVLLGDFSNERLDLNAIAHDFGWSIARTTDQSGLREISRSCTVIAVLIQTGALGKPWPEALRTVRAASTQTRIIMCHKADQARYRNEMIEAGAFGVLLSPLKYSEVRQLLGFVWASRIAPSRQLVPATRKTRPKDGAVKHIGAA